ncbi:MAG: transposase, partial [Chloroflexi bacterium]|nr:transposase [Chloroflexota bacterium]
NKFHPAYIIADAGYSGREFLSLIKRQYRATPVVQINKSHKRLLAQYGVQSTLEGKTLLKQRQAVERAFSRLKGQRSLNHITVRSRRKVTLHCYLSLIALQASYRASCPTLPS